MNNEQKVSRAAGAVSMMTLLSRLFGFARDVVIAMMFGSSAAADAFFVAFRLPNMQRRVLGEGAVSAAFIPMFAEIRDQKGKDEAWAFTANLLNILLVILAVSTLALWVFAPQVITVFAPGFLDEPGKFEITVRLTRWMAPYLIFIGLAAFCMGILNSFQKFALAAAAPVLLNISMIGAALWIAPLLDEPILGLATGVLIGGALQLAIQIPQTLRQGLRFSPRVDVRHPDIRRMAGLMGPVILGLAVYELNILADTLIASLLPGGSISYLYYGNRLVQFPLGIFGVALGVALLPMLSSQAAKKATGEFIQTLGFGIRMILFVTLPATVGLILLRFPIVNTLWERGEFTRASSEGTAVALLYYSLGLAAFSGIKVIVPAYYSLQDTKTPARIGIYSMLLNIILNLILMQPMGHGGLALATSLSSVFNVFMLIHLLRKRLGLMGGRRILASGLRIAVNAALMGGLIYLMDAAWFDAASPLLEKLLVLSVCVVAGVAAFAGLARFTQPEELRFLLSPGARSRTAK
jgi:putative peptidoglycan lipid II flippase